MSRLDLRRSTLLVRYGMALAAVLAAMGVRWSLHPVMGAVPPYITLYLAIVVAAVMGGRGPALFATAVGAVAALALANASGEVLDLTRLPEQTRLLIYLVSGAGISLVANAMDDARADALRHARAMQTQSDALARANAQLAQANEQLAQASRAKDEILAQARASAERVQLALAAGAIVGTWDWDLVSGKISVDERFAESFGIDPALGQSGLGFEQVIATIHPDDLPGVREAIEEGLRGGGPYSREYRVRGRDGRYHWIQANGRVDHGPDGKPLRFPGVLLDIEQRRSLEHERDQATQLLRAFIEAVPGVVYAKDTAGRMLLANRGVAELAGAPLEAFLGKTVMEFIPNKAQAAVLMENDRRIMEGGVAVTLEEALNYPDGRQAVWLTTKAPFRDAGGRVLGLVGTSVDITARKAAEQALVEADRLRNEFLAMLGHELRNPLAPISNAVHMLERAGERTELRDRAVQIIHRQVKHMARLVEDLLEVSRVTQGRIELRLERARLEAVLQAAAETVRPLMKERGQHFSLEVDGALALVMDPARMTQVVANLLNNASKYTQHGGEVTLAARVPPERPGWVEIVVRDNGPGIEPALLPKVFDLFTQGGTTIDRSRGGLGLGLALVKRLVELHGGTVQAESPPGGGACFTVSLPRREMDVPGAQPGSVAAPVKPLRVLVVDDNEDGAAMLQALLESDGHTVRREGDGESAMAAARAFHPDLVLLDIGLPGRDGWEVARALRGEPAGRDAVLVAVTGYGQPADLQRSREAGFDGHLLKPVSLEAVYGVMAGARS
ncbi:MULTISPECIES: ATP-binding protein [Ramlibacter]|uniref:histidine kinase n=1 Tax=Ramlibacter aquaticus TaxID=2780094 RepID=A0ABR9SFV6_9BURK|nr:MULTISPECIES: ATP-binding protein [Ramlibacter]MBE7941231.1 PAS domain-containing protein [Ramlibacter aquaticus]